MLKTYTMPRYDFNYYVTEIRDEMAFPVAPHPYIWTHDCYLLRRVHINYSRRAVALSQLHPRHSDVSGTPNFVDVAFSKCLHRTLWNMRPSRSLVVDIPDTKGL
jgi:hypothetical protein